MKKKVQESQEPTRLDSGEFRMLDALKTHWLPMLIIFITSVVVYSNTFSHEYALDDQMVIYDNKYVTAGVDSLGKIMTSDAFEGFFGERGSKLISGGRYRPLTYISFAIEWELFERNPGIGHVLNVLSYAFLSVLIYIFLVWLFPVKNLNARFYRSLLLRLPFVASLLYALHPIHTEVVANIKGRDEIFGFAFGLAAILYFFQFFKSKWHQFAILFLLFLAALLSKENAITFLAVIPFIAYMKNRSILTFQFMRPWITVLCAAIIYLVLRSMSTESSLSAYSEEILNNPFVRANASEKWGTIFFSYLEYLKLLVFPWKLSHDYYFNQIPYRKLSDPWVLVSLLAIAGLLFIGFKNLKRKNEIAFSIFFFIATFSIVSNLFFTVGIIMNERFVFVSSLGFSILMAYMLLERIKNAGILTAALIILILFYSYKTYTRNFAWKNNDTLFSTDFYNSPNSAKVSTSFGGSLLERANDMRTKDSIASRILLDSSIKVLEHSLTIYPENSQAWLLYGNAVYARTRDISKAIAIYRNCLIYRPSYFDALYNIGTLHYTNGQLDSAEQYLSFALQTNPSHKEVRETLGKIYAQSGRTAEAISLANGQTNSLSKLALESIKGGNYQEAIRMAQQVLAENAGDAEANYVIGICYSRHLNRLQEGIPYLENAVRSDSTNGVWMEDLAVAYGMSGQVKKTIPLLERVIALRPNEAAGYQNLATTYNILGDTKKAAYYLELARQKTQQP